MFDLFFSTLSPYQKVNYDKVFQKMSSTWQEAGLRPKILIHVCFAPCSTYTLEYLTQYADVNIYLANSN
ncbi:epoxyqueuosine reductase QueH, partial [Streptococcus suis]